MPAAGRRCRQPVRHSVHLSGPRRRRRLLSPDARGQPRAARSSRGPARRRAPPPPGPAPALFPVCPSVRPPARLRFRPPVQPPALSPSPRSARFVSPRLAVSLSLPSRCLAAPPSFPTSGPLNAPLSSLGASLSERPPSLGLFQNTFHTPGAPL